MKLHIKKQNYISKLDVDPQRETMHPRCHHMVHVETYLNVYG